MADDEQNEVKRDTGSDQRIGLSTKHVDLDRVEKRLKNALRKDVDHLCRMASEEGGLSRDRSNSLVNYMKLIRDMKKQEAAEGGTVSTEELERLAKEEENPKDS